MSSIDEAVEVLTSEAIDAARLGAYLAEHLAGFSGPLAIRQFPAGFSNLSYLLTADGRECVLRRPPIGTRPRSGHDMGREFRVLSALAPDFPECPRPVHHCADESVIGAPFYLVERIRGIILRRDYPAGLAATPVMVRAQQHALVATLARLHGLDCRAPALAELGRPEGYVARQVAGWTERYERARTPDVASADAVTAWLAASQPVESRYPAVIHNDYKLDNVVFDAADPARLIGVLDWEMATVGDPLMDLGCSLAYWVEKNDPAPLQLSRMGPTNLPGMPTRKELVERYAQRSGMKIENIDFYYVFGLFRLGVIAQQIYYRYYHKQVSDKRFAMFGQFVTYLSQVCEGVIARSAL